MASEVHIDLLPHQFDLLEDMQTRILGLCSGYGGGKTWSAARKAIILMFANPGCDGMITEPTHPLLVQVLFPELEQALDDFGIAYKFNKQDKIFTCWVWDPGRERNIKTRIICASMENYKRLVGVNAAWCIMDEFDTAPPDVAYAAYTKLLGRLRKGKVRQMVIVSTPEGFRALYKIFVLEADEMKRLIKAKSTDNPHLPDDYIKTMLKQYTASLVEAYINGEFVNMTSGVIYHQFDRQLNNTSAAVEDGDDLHIGMDFNVGNMSAIVHVYRRGKPRAVEEIVKTLDTPTMIRVIQDRYPGHTIYVYPDASGSHRDTRGASESDINQLQAAGFVAIVDASNPPVKDRINSMQSQFCNAAGDRNYKVNVRQCPEYARCLEQQVWDENGQPDKKAGVDHCNDAAGYFIAKAFPLIKPVENLKIGIRR